MDQRERMQISHVDVKRRTFTIYSEPIFYTFQSHAKNIFFYIFGLILIDDCYNHLNSARLTVLRKVTYENSDLSNPQTFP